MSSRQSVRKMQRKNRRETLRALSATESQRQGGDATALLGHTDARTTRSYLRDKEAARVVGPKWGAK